MCTGYWCGILRERNHLQEPGAERKINIKMDHQEVSWGMHCINLDHDKDGGRQLYTWS